MSKDPGHEKAKGPFGSKLTGAQGESWGTEGTMTEKKGESTFNLAWQ